MKKLITIVCLVMFVGLAMGQEPTDPKEFVYCQLVGQAKMLSSKVTVEVDFGQEKNWNSSKLRGEDGKPISFNSMVDAMNFMGALGWEFQQAYVITSGQTNVYHWLLRKKANTEELQALRDMVAKQPR